MIDDPGYRRMFQDALMAADFASNFLDEDIVARLDLTTLRPMPTSRISERFQRRENDIVWSVALKDHPDRRIYLYLMLEFQSTVDRNMAARMLAYVALLYEELLGLEKPGDDRKLGPIYPVVVYNGRRPWRAERQVAALIEDLGAPLDAHVPRMTYELVEVRRCGEPRTERSLSGAVFRIDRSEGPADAAAGVRDLIAWSQGPEYDRFQKSCMGWIQGMLAVRMEGGKMPETKTLHDVQEWLEDSPTTWPRKWIQQGRQEGIAALQRALERLARARFGESVVQPLRLTLETVQDPERLDEIGEWIEASASAEALLARLRTL